MQYRSIAVGMIEDTYNTYKNYWTNNPEYDSIDLREELNKFDIPVWGVMNINTKCAAIEYVYNHRHTLELHSDCVESWVQATAYFMILNFASLISEDADIEIFFDDLDFMMESDTLRDKDIQEQFGISKDFTNNF
jgi:hypothetical protein